ncbi:MAG: hypothetical protein M3Y07_01345 [Acidobacteriota bacterium]|nr:hypothetical protein [Acidobacteriota bacterium]
MYEHFRVVRPEAPNNFFAHFGRRRRCHRKHDRVVQRFDHPSEPQIIGPEIVPPTR